MTDRFRWEISGRQHWLYGDGRVRGLVYALNPSAFTVYQEGSEPAGSKGWGVRDFLTQVDTLDEAKNLLQTIIGSQL